MSMRITNLIGEEEAEKLAALAEQYRILHERGQYRGGLEPYFIRAVDFLSKRCQAVKLLDYGSGKGEQYSIHNQHATWGILPTCYDPGYDPFSRKPQYRECFDGVICTDVLEHISPDCLGSVVLDIFRYAKKFVFLSVFVGEAKSILPDGRNAHLTVRCEEWWLRFLHEKLKESRPGYAVKISVEDRHTILVTSKPFKVAVVFRSKEKKVWE